MYYFTCYKKLYSEDELYSPLTDQKRIKNYMNNYHDTQLFQNNRNSAIASLLFGDHHTATLAAPSVPGSTISAP